MMLSDKFVKFVIGKEILLRSCFEMFAAVIYMDFSRQFQLLKMAVRSKANVRWLVCKEQPTAVGPDKAEAMRPVRQKKIADSQEI